MLFGVNKIAAKQDPGQLFTKGTVMSVVQVNPASHQLSVIASNTLAKCGFLCQVLAENHDYFHLAFKVGLFGLELARPPASTKPLEVLLTTSCL